MSARQKKGYQVGYGKPPTKGQFRKGKSGNPKGRPRKAANLKSLESILIAALNSPVLINEGKGPSRKVTKYDTAIMQIVNNAAIGKIQHIKILIDLIKMMSASSERAPLWGDILAENSAQERIMKKIDQMSSRMEAARSKSNENELP